MMNKYVFIIFIFVSIVSACTSDKEVYDGNKLEYQATSISFPGKLPFNVDDVYAFADSSGRVNVYLQLEMENDFPVSEVSYDWELETPSGLRSTASLTIDTTQHEVTRYKLTFEPVNSLQLYKLSGLKGDLSQEYKLNFRGGDGTTSFRLSDEIYKTYKKRREVPTVFMLQIPSEFANQQTEYLNKKLNSEHSTEVHDQEILTQGLNTSLLGYVLHDTLVLKLRLVNHSLYPVMVNSDSLCVIVGNKALLPGKLFGSITIPRSQRAFIEMHYPIQEIKNVSVKVSGITFLTPEPVPVFYTDLLGMKPFQP